MAQFHYVFLFKLSLIIMILLRTCVNGKRFGTTKLGSKFTIVPTNVDVVNPKSKEYEVYNYTQTLGHFNFKSESYTTFQQHYVLNRKYWGGTAKSFPIFVYTGAESSIMGYVEYNGFEMTLVSQFKASMPFGSYEEAYKNANTLGFFTLEQALEDYAQITLHVKNNLSAKDCPVIAIGGSYGGSKSYVIY
ncbi:putative lysosomal Pro-Xaa carboxypeptidase [Helianthus anomalus]